jgi:sigma-B regulation protein RsbU (phosphoserine phosphatase)
MKIRWKLAFLLLAIALPPALLMSYWGHRATSHLGQQISTQVRRNLTEGAKRELRRIVEGYTNVLDRDRQILELMINIQAREVERRLAEQVPEDSLDAYFAEDFEELKLPEDQRRLDDPPMLVPSPNHRIDRGTGQTRPMKVSFEHHVNWVAPGVRRDEVAPMVARMADMSHVFRALHREHPELLLWQYTGFENGLHISYPGKSRFATDYDSRQRPWYQGAVQAEGPNPLWWPPVVDMSTRQVILTLAKAVRWPDGRVAGVTCIDVPLTNVLLETRLPEGWIEQSKVMLVWAVEDMAASRNPILQQVEDLPEDPRPLIMAQKSYQRRERGGDWRVPVSLQLLDSPQTEQIQAVMQDMLAGRSAARLMTFQGQPAVWAYGPVDEQGTYLTIVVPEQLIVAGAKQAEQRVIEMTWQRLQGTGVLLACVVGAILLVGWKGAEVVTGPLEKLASAARRITAGDLSARVEVDQRDELGELAVAFNRMVPKLQDRVHMQEALNLAMEVQQRLLPQGPPKLEHLSIATHSAYCDETGGDYYDFLRMPPADGKRWCIAVGDVTGHGISAALLMATCRALLRSRLASPCTLDQVLRDMNHHLTLDDLDGRFMTLFLLAIEPGQPGEPIKARWASAGHDPAILYDPAQDTFRDLEGARDLPLGVMADWDYTSVSQGELQPGQVVVMGTDGVWETLNPENKQFGKDRIRRIIRDYAAQGVEVVRDRIVEAVRRYRGPEPQQDDVTMVVLQVQGEASRPAEAPAQRVPQSQEA